MIYNGVQLATLLKKNPRAVFGLETIKFKNGSGKVTFSSVTYGLKTVWNNSRTLIDQVEYSNLQRYVKTLSKSVKLLKPINTAGKYAKALEKIVTKGEKLNSKVRNVVVKSRNMADRGIKEYTVDKLKKKSFLYSRFDDIKTMFDDYKTLKRIPG